MLDIVEGAKIVQAVAPTTMGANDDGDYISMANAHTVWTIVDIRKPTSEVTITPKTASAYAGTGSSAISGGAKFWVNTNTTNLDRVAATTYTTAYALSDNSNSALIVCRFDPAAAPSSHPYFSMTGSSAGTAAAGRLSMVYILESRYPGYQQIISTTSST